MINEATAKAKSDILYILRKTVNLFFSHMYTQKAKLNHAIKEKL